MSDHERAIDLVMALPPNMRLPVLIRSIFEMHRTTDKITKALLDMLIAMSQQHSTQARCELANLFRDAADEIEAPLLAKV